MAQVFKGTFKAKHGPKSNLKTLDEGVFGVTNDTNEVFVGSASNSNIQLAKKDDVDAINSALSQKISSVNGVKPGSDGNVTIATDVGSADWVAITNKPTFSNVATTGSYNDLSNKPVIPPAFTLPVATDSVLGGVKQGSGISIDTDGTLTASSGATSVPMASGMEADLPIVPIGTYYFCTDSYKVYFGTPVGNLLQGTATPAAPPANTGGGTTATPTVVFSDDFTRADSTTSPGTSNSYAGGTNKAWVVDSGTLGIISGQLYTPNTAACRTHIDAGVSDAVMEVKVTAVGNEHDFYFRQDTSNPAFYLRYAYNSSGWYLQEGGNTFTTIKSFPGTIAANDVISINCSGSTVTLSKNGTVIDTSNALTDLQTNTGFGVGFSGSTAGRFDNFKITSSVIPASGSGDTTPPSLTVTPGTNTVFTGTQSVTMSATDANGATIYYTTDGSDPKTSATKLTYSSALSLSTTTTIKAFAQDPSGNQSATQMIVYTLTGTNVSTRKSDRSHVVL